MFSSLLLPDSFTRPTLHNLLPSVFALQCKGCGSCRVLYRLVEVSQESAQSGVILVKLISVLAWSMLCLFPFCYHLWSGCKPFL